MADATVVIPVRDGANLLPRCLEALKGQTHVGLEIIVVDDGSTDASAAIAQSIGVRVLRQEKAGPAAARNFGTRVAGSPIILFTDADCAPHAEWAVTLLNAFEDGSISGCKGTYSSRQRQLIARFVQLDYEDRYRRMGRHASNIDFIDTYSAAYRQSVLTELGGFDESFKVSSVEDQELSFRAVAAGHKLVFEPRARVDHLHPTTLSSYVRKKFKIGFYKAQLHVRLSGRLSHDSHTPTILRAQTLVAIVVLFMAPASLRTSTARALIITLLVCIGASGIPLAIRATRTDAEVAMITPAMTIVRAVALGAGLLCGCAGLLVAKAHFEGVTFPTPRRVSSFKNG